MRQLVAAFVLFTVAYAQESCDNSKTESDLMEVQILLAAQAAQIEVLEGFAGADAAASASQARDAILSRFSQSMPRSIPMPSGGAPPPLSAAEEERLQAVEQATIQLGQTLETLSMGILSLSTRQSDLMQWVNTSLTHLGAHGEKNATQLKKNITELGSELTSLKAKVKAFEETQARMVTSGFQRQERINEQFREIQGTLKKLTQKQLLADRTAIPTIPLPSAENDILNNELSESAKWDQLIQWITDNGGDVEGLSLQEIEDDYRGVVANRDIRVNSLITIPRSCLIGKEEAEASPIGLRLIPLLGRRQASLAAFLLAERFNQSSHWKPYLQIFPKTFPYHFHFLSNEQREAYNNTPIWEIYNSTYSYYKSEYTTIAEAIPAFANYSVEQYLWARVAVTSRIFTDKVKETGQDKAFMVPLVDMLNHHPRAQTHWSWSEATQNFNLEFNKPVSAGDVVFDRYGAKPNANYLLHYGFTLPYAENYQNEKTYFTLGFPDDGKVTTKTSLLYQFTNLEGQTYTCQLGFLYNYELHQHDKHLTQSCFGFARIAQADDETIAMLTGNGVIGSLKNLLVEPLWLDNELKAYSAIAEQLQLIKKNYTTSFEEDRDRLKKGGLDQFQLNALHVQLGWKGVVENWLTYQPLVQQLAAILEEEKEMKESKEKLAIVAKWVELLEGSEREDYGQVLRTLLVEHICDLRLEYVSMNSREREVKQQVPYITAEEWQEVRIALHVANITEPEFLDDMGWTTAELPEKLPIAEVAALPTGATFWREQYVRYLSLFKPYAN